MRKFILSLLMSSITAFFSSGLFQSIFLFLKIFRIELFRSLISLSPTPTLVEKLLLIFIVVFLKPVRDFISSSNLLG